MADTEETSTASAVQVHVPAGAKALAASTGSILSALLMTPFDVVKTRMQSELRIVPRGAGRGASSLAPPRVSWASQLPATAPAAPTASWPRGSASTLKALEGIPWWEDKEQSARLMKRPRPPMAPLTPWSSTSCLPACCRPVVARTCASAAFNHVSGAPPLSAPCASSSAAVDSRDAGNLRPQRSGALRWTVSSRPVLWPYAHFMKPTSDFVTGVYRAQRLDRARKPADAVSNILSRVHRAIKPAPPQMEHVRQVVSQNVSVVRPRSAGAMLAHVVRTEGVRSLWSGVLPTLLMAVPSTMMYFVAYEELKEAIEDWSNETSPVWHLAPLFAGGLARAGAATVVNPLELIRTKMQAPAFAQAIEAQGATQQGVAARVGGIVSASARQLLNSFREEINSPSGVRSLWRGLAPTLLRDVPFSMIYWLGFERIRAALEERLQASEESAIDRFTVAFAAGAVSGAVAATVTTPFDVVKTRMQIQLYKMRHLPDAQAEVMPMIHRIVAEEGASGMFAGLGARLAKVAPACAIMISSYEVSKLLIANRR
jgi:hypothetical protein